MKRPIYLDYAATTPLDPRIQPIMNECLTLEGCFGNSASITHIYGTAAKDKIAQAQTKVAELINAHEEEIIWTSGATEANNLAIIGAACFYNNKGKHIITCKTEHKSVIDPCLYLRKKGFEVSFLKPQKNGLLLLDDLKKAMRKDTILVSIMHVNNELGVIQNIQAISELCRENNILFHTDATQSIGKIAHDLQKLPVDLMSFSAHKMYGPKGIGVLYIRKQPKVRLQPLIYGGGQQDNLRSGTLATHQIVAMGEACYLAKYDMEKDNRHIKKLREKFWHSLTSLPEIYLNGDAEHSVAHILNFSVGGVDGTALIYAIPNLAVATGSACTSATTEASHVLTALHLPNNLLNSNLRISFGRFSKEAEIDLAIEELKQAINRLRKLSPCWRRS